MQKNNVHSRSISALVVIILLASISLQAQIIPFGLVKYVSHSESGTVKLELSMFGKKKIAVGNAPERAFHAILFEGLAQAKDVKLQHGFIKNEKRAKQSHSAYFHSLFEEKNYLQYIHSVSDPKRIKVKGLKEKKAYQIFITINYKTLLSDLRKEGLIEKMGF